MKFVIVKFVQHYSDVANAAVSSAAVAKYSSSSNPTWVCLVEFNCCWSNGTKAGKTGLLASRLSRSLKVIGTNTDQSGTCYFLLTFRCNHGPVLYLAAN